MKKRVLLVENNVPTIDVMKLELMHLGYEVSVAKNGLEAVKMAFADPPDLIIVEIRLPKMDGLEATALIRENPATRDVPILAATTKTMQGDREKCLASGCDGYIAKPFTHGQLQAAIARILESRLHHPRTKG